MYNTKFILTSGQEIYPGYLSKERRQELKDQFQSKEFMWCGCKAHPRLYYRISEDLKIYPEHNNYVHDSCCCRYRTETGEAERKTAYLINDEDGVVTAFLTFNPKNYDPSEKTEKEQNNTDINDENTEDEMNEAVIEKETEKTKDMAKKEPKLSLGALIRSINVDTFTEKVMNGQKINSKDLFSKYVYHRMAKVRPSKSKKAIGELSLETDGVRFIYVPFAEAIRKTEKGLTKCYFCNKGPDGTVYKNFIYPETMDKAIKEFAKMYGMEPDENTMMAGFQYAKKTRSGATYKVLGRVHLFQVSKVGLYCRSQVEQDAFNALYRITESDPNISFWIPPDDDSIGGIIQLANKKKKLLLLFRTKKDERIIFDEEIYEPYIVGADEPVLKEDLYRIFEQLEGGN